MKILTEITQEAYNALPEEKREIVRLEAALAAKLLGNFKVVRTGVIRDPSTDRDADQCLVPDKEPVLRSRRSAAMVSRRAPFSAG